jgi:hypothetical protein
MNSGQLMVNDQLKEIYDGSESFFVLGCMDLDLAFVIPHSLITTKESPDRMYWRIKIREDEEGNYKLLLPKISDTLNINSYSIKLISA